MSFENAYDILSKTDPLCFIGKVKNIAGMMIETTGLSANVGDICMIRNPNEQKTIMSEVVGFKNSNLLLTAYGDVKGIGLGSLVYSTKSKLRVPVGDFLVGRTIDATGSPMDGLGEFNVTEYYDVDSTHTNPLDRPRINTRLDFGIKAIDGMLAIGGSPAASPISLCAIANLVKESIISKTSFP